MSRKNLKRLELIKGAAEGVYTPEQVAGWLGLSARSVKQLVRKFLEQGEEAVVHGNSGKQPANYIDEEFRTRIVTLKKSAVYSETSFARFRELLEEREGIQISYTALSGILKSAGIAPKIRHGEETGYFKRRGAMGELLHAGAAAHNWFGADCFHVLHLLVDDATGNVTGMHFCRRESTMGYAKVLRQTITKHGIPSELSPERTGILFAENGRENSGRHETPSASERPRKTQLGFIVEELLGPGVTDNAEMPHARNRLKRLWEILRRQIPAWLKNQGVSTMDKANRELHRYIALFNDKHAVQPRLAESVFTPLGGYNPDRLLAVRYDRITDGDGCFSFQNFVFRVDSATPLTKRKIQFRFSPTIKFLAKHGSRYYGVSVLNLEDSGRIIDSAYALEILVRKHYYDGLT